MESIVVKWDNAALDHLLKQPTGPVGVDIQGRADRVKWAAKAQAGMKTGALKLSIHTDFQRSAAGPKVYVGSSLRYALAHHEGTKPHLIVAKPGKVLRFVSRGRFVHTDRIIHPGTKPNRYLTDNLPLVLSPGIKTPGSARIITI